MIKVGLLWHSVNSDNLGVVALTVSNIAIVEAVAASLGENVTFEIYGWRDPGPDQISRPNVKVMPLRGRDIIDPQRLLRSAKSCDVVLDISAGDSFADIYGARRFTFNILAKLAVYLAGTPLVMSPQTIGPFSRGWAKFLAGVMMRRAEVVIARDKLSSEYLAQFNLGSPLEATDVAFRLPYAKRPSFAGTKTHVGVNVSGLLYNGGYGRSNDFGLKSDYKDFSRRLLKNIAADPNNQLHLIGHVNSERFEVEDDYRVAQKLGLDFPGAIVAPRFANPSEAKSYISNLSFFCGARMHACIAAFSSGVPVVPIAYSRKFIGLFGTLGYSHVVDCKTQSADEMINLIMQGLANRAALKTQVEHGCALAETKLAVYDQALRDILLQQRTGKRR
jgi:colanic acid/amylovoran biosynthesis protein